MDRACEKFFAMAILGKDDKKAASFCQVQKSMTEPIAKAIMEVGDKLAGINLLEIVTPINQEEEKQKWMAEAPNEIINPRFKYDEALLNRLIEAEPKVQRANTICEQFIRELKNEDVIRIIMILVRHRVLEALDIINIAKSMLERDDMMTAALLTRIYGLPDDSATLSAYQYAVELTVGDGMIRQQTIISPTEAERLAKSHFNAEQARRIFLFAAEECGFAETRPIILSDQVSAITVRDRSSQGAMVMIPRQATYDGAKLLGLVAHEILCHWRDSENVKLFSGNLKSANEMLSEGHAMYEQSQVELTFHGKTRRLALPWRIIAIDLAKNGANFAKTAAALYPMILATEHNEQSALEETWKTCMRTFRGSTQTENACYCYAFPKDRVYFEGKTLVAAMHNNKIGDYAEFGVMTLNDLYNLGQAVKFDTAELKYRRPENVIMKVYEKMMEVI